MEVKFLEQKAEVTSERQKLRFVSNFQSGWSKQWGKMGNRNSVDERRLVQRRFSTRQNHQADRMKFVSLGWANYADMRAEKMEKAPSRKTEQEFDFFEVESSWRFNDLSLDIKNKFAKRDFQPDRAQSLAMASLGKTRKQMVLMQGSENYSNDFSNRNKQVNLFKSIESKRIAKTYSLSNMKHMSNEKSRIVENQQLGAKKLLEYDYLGKRQTEKMNSNQEGNVRLFRPTAAIIAGTTSVENYNRDGWRSSDLVRNMQEKRAIFDLNKVKNSLRGNKIGTEAANTHYLNRLKFDNYLESKHKAIAFGKLAKLNLQTSGFITSNAIIEKKKIPDITGNMTRFNMLKSNKKMKKNDLKVWPYFEFEKRKAGGQSQNSIENRYELKGMLQAQNDITKANNALLRPRLDVHNQIHVSGNEIVANKQADPIILAEQIGKLIVDEIQSSISGYYG